MGPKKKLIEDEEFIKWVNSGIYQPIPIEGLYTPSVRGFGCELRWQHISNILPKNKRVKTPAYSLFSWV